MMEDEKTYHPVPTGNPVSDTAKFLRDWPPAHYILQIDSFSLLLDVLEGTKNRSYDSMTFEACGYKWKLCLKPNGDDKRNGTAFISLCLRLEETDALPLGWEIDVNCTFFVLDQIQEKYLTIQEFRHLYVLKKEIALNRLMQRDVFEDEKNGYLVQDKCVFGVEVSVNTYTGRGECLASCGKLSSTTYTWKIVDYSKTQTMRCSEIFTRQDYKWRLNFYPRGSESEKGNNISLFLESLDHKATLSVYAGFMLRLKDQVNGKDIEKTVRRLFTCSEDSWGFNAFLSLDEFENATKGFLVNDTLIVEVDFDRISCMKSFEEK